MTVEEAQKLRVCRICEQEFSVPGPAGWPSQFKRMVFPVRVLLNFGQEFAHEDCVQGEK